MRGVACIRVRCFGVARALAAWKTIHQRPSARRGAARGC